MKNELANLIFLSIRESRSIEELAERLVERGVQIVPEGAKMSRDKQIEEMARALGEGRSQNCNHYVCCSACPCDFCCIFQENAHILVQEGYRKTSEVAREIFAEIDDFQRTLRHIFLDMCGGNDYNTLNLLQIDSAIEALFDSRIAELKKKYTEEGK